MKSLGKNNRWIGVVAVGQAAVIGFLWTGNNGIAPARAAGIPDSGAQMQEIIDQLKATNARVDRLITLLSDGKLEVTLRKTDDVGRNR